MRANPGTSSGSVFTSQLFFDDSLTDQVFTTSPYSARGTRDTLNSRDNVYGSNGAQLQLAVSSDGAGGYSAKFTIGIEVANPVATSTAVATSTPAATATPGGCQASFSDVSSSDYFYDGVSYLYCAGAVSGLQRWHLPSLQQRYTGTTGQDD